MSRSCLVAVLTCAVAQSCSVYDASLIKLRDAGPEPERDAAANGGDAATDYDSGAGDVCIFIEENSSCTQSCPESCNGLDDDCDGRIDEVDRRSSCRPPHSISVCAGNECLIAACTDGYVDCNGDPADGCETTLDTPEHCGVCGHSCALVNSEAECDAGECVQRGCEPGYADCDDNPRTGCERSLATLSDCGECGQACKLANAIMRCEKACEFTACAPGWGDCNSDAHELLEGDGCETHLDTPEQCGECGKSCSGATPYCSGGQCSALRCDPDVADCDANNMECETNLRSVTNCGGCGVTCGPFDHAANGCGSGQCVLTCNEGWDDCDESGSNGCETNIRTNTDCGRCGMGCNYPNATTSCSSGTCTLGSCTPGFGDCNSDLAADGCEERLNSATHCGACNRPCSLANATASCSSGSCQVSSCAPNFGNCDAQADTGCETNLSNSNQHCGNCNAACPNGQTCSNGRCTCTANSQCASGQACCGGACVGTGSDEANCGVCGNVCGSGQTCCSGACRSLSSDTNNCGACGTRCGSNANRCTNGSCRCTNDAPCPRFYSCCTRGCDFATCL